MAEGTVYARRRVVCPADVQIQDNVQNAIVRRDVQTEAIIQTDNVHIHTEIYSTTNDELPAVPCPAFEHHNDDYMILHSSRSKNIATEGPEIVEFTRAVICDAYLEDKQRQVSKIQTVDSPQKDSWDEGTRLLSETQKQLGAKKQICHPDCPNLQICRSTQFEQADEARKSSERSDTFTTTQTDIDDNKGISKTSNNVAPAATNLATIPEEDSVHSTGGSEPNLREDDQPMASVAEEQDDEQVNEQIDEQVDEQIDEQVDEQIDEQVDEQIDEQVDEQIDEQVDEQIDEQVNENDEDYEQTEASYDEEVETDREEEQNTTEKGTMVPTESILETNPRKRQRRFVEPTKWKSGAWIKSPSPTRFAEAETRSCARLIRSSSSQLTRGERCVSSIRCVASSNRFYADESARRAEQFSSADCSKSSSTFCKAREPFACDLLRAINNAKRQSPAGEPFESCVRPRPDRNRACNRYYSNFNETCTASNDCWYPRDRHGTYTSQYTARTMMNYCTTSYCYSVNTWR